MRRVQQPMLHVSSSINNKPWLSYRCLFRVCYDACARVYVGACGSVCWNPTFQLLVIFCPACCCSSSMPTATGTTTMRVWTTVMHVCSSWCMRVCVVYVLSVHTTTMQQQPHSKFAWTTSMCVDMLTLHIIYVRRTSVICVCMCGVTQWYVNMWNVLRIAIILLIKI